MPGFRRQAHSHLGKPIGRAVARTVAYPVRTRLVAVARAQQRRQRVVDSIIRRPFGFTPAPSVAPRPIRRTLAAVARATQRRQRVTRSILRRPIGRALSRLVPYPIRAVLAAWKRGAQPARRQLLHSKLRRPFGFFPAVGQRPARPIRTALAAIARQATRRRYLGHPRLGDPVGRAVARNRPYPIRVQLASRAAVHPRRRVVRSRLRRPFGFLLVRLPRPIRTRLVAVQRAVAPQRRRVRSLLRRPIGRALAKLVPYRIRAVLQGRNRQGQRQRIVISSLLRQAFGAPLPPNTGGPVSGPTRILGQAANSIAGSVPVRLLGAAANRLLGGSSSNRMSGGGSNRFGGE